MPSLGGNLGSCLMSKSSHFVAFCAPVFFRSRRFELYCQRGHKQLPSLGPRAVTGGDWVCCFSETLKSGGGGPLAGKSEFAEVNGL